MTSGGYNLSSDNGGGFLTKATDQTNTDAVLGPLQNNGGPTFTCALLTGSPAIDKGRRKTIPALALNTDQRGLLRPVVFPGIPEPPGGDGSDIGAFELQAPVANGPLLLTGPQKLRNGAFQFSFTNAPGVNYTIWVSLDLKTWVPAFILNDGSGGVLTFVDLTAVAAGQRFYRVQVGP